MHPQEKCFALKVEEMLKTTLRPENRQLIVEVRNSIVLLTLEFDQLSAVTNGVISGNRT